MQIELRTQVIEPRRKTFQHLIDRYGDRPASRYEEGTVDLLGMRSTPPSSASSNWTTRIPSWTRASTTTPPTCPLAPT